MRHNKYIDGNYIVSIGIGDGGSEITENEYITIMEVIENKPAETDTIGYRLKTDLTWEQYEKEPIPEDDPTAEEIVSILTGESE